MLSSALLNFRLFHSSTGTTIGVDRDGSRGVACQQTSFVWRFGVNIGKAVVDSGCIETGHKTR